MRRRRVAALGLLAALASLGAAPAAEPTPPPARAGEAPASAAELLAAMATVTGLEAKFVERKQLQLLRAPLISEGTLYYTQPGYLTRVVDLPAPSEVRIGPGALRVRDATGDRHIDLTARPDVAAFVRSFVDVVAGDETALARTYTLNFARTDEPTKSWRLTLTPREEPLSRLVARIEIIGQGHAIAAITVIETSGDQAEITLREVDPHRRFTDAERERFFGLAPAP